MRPDAEITDEMVKAGAKILADVLDVPPYSAKFIARDVFVQMARLGRHPAESKD